MLKQHVTKVFTYSSVLLTLLGTVSSVPIQAAGSYTILTTADSIEQAKQLKSQMDDLLNQENHLKAKIYAARGKLMKTNNSISNAELKIADLKNQRDSKADELADVNNQIDTQSNLVDKERKQIISIYRSVQNDKDNEGFFDQFNLAGREKENQIKDSTNDAVLQSKRQYSKDKAKLDDLKAQKASINQDLNDISNNLAVQQEVRSQLKHDLNKDDFVKHSFDPAKMIQVQALQDKHDSLQKKFAKLTTHVINKADDSSDKKLTTDKKNIKSIQAKVNQSTKNLNQMTGEEMDNLKVDLSKINAAIDKANQEQADSSTSDSTNTSSDDSDVMITPTTTKNATATQKALVKLAEKQLGIPYVWGGTTRNGFDCSGLTQYLYAHAAGIQLPRVSQQQSTVGKRVPVSVNTLQPGDLLFWGGVGTAHHVAIYIGDGDFIQAPEPGQNVKVTKLDWYRPDFARRILNN